MCAEPHALTRAHKYTHTKKTEKCLNVIAHAYIKIPVKKTKKKTRRCVLVYRYTSTHMGHSKRSAIPALTEKPACASIKDLRHLRRVRAALELTSLSAWNICLTSTLAHLADSLRHEGTVNDHLVYDDCICIAWFGLFPLYKPICFT